MGDKSIPDGTETTVTRTSDKKIPGAARAVVAVDTALLTVDVDRRQLLVVEMQRIDTGKWALPGTFLKDREMLDHAVKRCLDDKIGITGVRPQRLEVLDDPDRDERDWVISVAHVAVVRLEALGSLGQGEYPTRLVPVDRPGVLAWDHPKIVRLAKEHVRSRYEHTPDPDGLLGKEFTLGALQRVHEAVAGDELDQFRFRRAMKPQLVGTGEFADPGGGRPAEFFRHKREDDEEPDDPRTSSEKRYHRR